MSKQGEILLCLIELPDNERSATTKTDHPTKLWKVKQPGK